MPLQIARFLLVTHPAFLLQLRGARFPTPPSLSLDLSPKSFAEDPMVDAWAAVASWATPTALFILLNVVIGFIAVFASRKNDDAPPPDHHNQFQYHHQQQQQQEQIRHLHEESPKRLVRAPSLFSRVTSFDFSNLNYCVSSYQHYESAPYTSDDNGAVQPPLARAPSLLSRMTSFSNFYLHGSVESEVNYAPAPPVTDEKHHLPPEPVAEVAPAPSLLERMASFNRFSLNKSVEPESQPPIERSPSLLSRMASIKFSFQRSMEPELEPEPAEAAALAEAREEHVTRSLTEPKKKKPPAGSRMNKSASEKGETTSLGVHDDCVDAKADDFINRFKQQLRLQRLDSLLRYRSSAGSS